MTQVFELSGADALLRHLRPMGVGLSALPDVIPGEVIDPKRHRAVTAAPSLGLERPLFWVRDDGKDVVVDADLVDALKRVDATRRDGNVETLCHFRDGVWTRIEPRRLVEGLLRAEIITTYWHVSATLEIVEELETTESYRAHLVGQHEYYTQERNVEDLDFYIWVDARGVRLSRDGT